MIEITTYTDKARTVRDRAWAETPEEAVTAARTLLTEASEHGKGFVPRASFSVDGTLVRRDLTFADLIAGWVA